MTEGTNTLQGEPAKPSFLELYQAKIMNKLQGRSNQDISRLSGISVGHISSIRNGNGRPTEATLDKLSDACNAHDIERAEKLGVVKTVEAPAPDLVAMAEGEVVDASFWEVPKVGDVVWIKATVDHAKDNQREDFTRLFAEDGVYFTYETRLLHPSPAPSDSAEVKRLKEQVEALTNEAVKMGKTIESLEFRCKQQSDAADLFLKQRDSLRMKLSDIETIAGEALEA